MKVDFKNVEILIIMTKSSNALTAGNAMWL